MRTNINLDDELVEAAMRLTAEPTKTAVVHRALRELVRLERLRRVRDARGTLHWKGDLARLREEGTHAYRPTRRHKRAR